MGDGDRVARDARGALVRCTAVLDARAGTVAVTQTRPLVGIGGHAGKQNEFIVHFGVGAAPGPVILEVDGRREFAELGPHQQHEFRVDLTGNKPHVPLTIESVNGFRPSEQNAESRDRRWLGCWVTLQLE